MHAFGYSLVLWNWKSVVWLREILGIICCNLIGFASKREKEWDGKIDKKVSEIRRKGIFKLDN